MIRPSLSAEPHSSRSMVEPIWLEWLALAGMLAFAAWLLGGRGVWSLLLQLRPDRPHAGHHRRVLRLDDLVRRALARAAAAAPLAGARSCRRRARRAGLGRRVLGCAAQCAARCRRAAGPAARAHARPAPHRLVGQRHPAQARPAGQGDRLLDPGASRSARSRTSTPRSRRTCCAASRQAWVSRCSRRWSAWSATSCSDCS